MAASPPSSSAIPPSNSQPPPSSLSPPLQPNPNATVDPPTSTSTSPPPSVSQPNPNATADPPTSSSTSPPPSDSQLNRNATANPPTSSSTSPPPSVSTAPPPSVSSPPPSLSATPPTSSPSPPIASPPPTPPNAPPPTSSSPPPPIVSSPPPSVPPPTPTLSPPPPTLPSSPPSASPPPSGSPPITIPPPSPPKPQPSPPPPPSATPPSSPSQPPPSASPPTASPPPPVPGSPPPSGSLTPPSVPSAPPPKTQPPPKNGSPSAPSPPSPPPPKNGSPATPSPPSPPPPRNSSSGAGPPPPVVVSPPGVSASPPSSSVPSVNPPGPISPVVDGSPEVSTNSTSAQGGSNSTGSDGISSGTAVSMSVVAGLLILSFVGVVVWFMRKRKRNVGGYNAGFVMPSAFTSPHMSEASYPKSPTAPLVYHSSGSHGLLSSSPNPEMGNSKSWFTYEELFEITEGFSNKNLLGEGGFGCVYKGCLPDGREVAVKQLKVGGGQGEREFKAEVEIISRVHHRHLVSLVGYCISENQRLLVYDYVPNGTLDDHLHGQGRSVMDWATRVRVAAGAARGIAYLHEDCHPRIIHRDIKSSNILIDNNFEAQVADFGLARLNMDAATHVTTRVMGTFGYLAPEYASSGKLTDRSDVYSFGVVLLELITGRKPVDSSQPSGDESLVEWARPLLSLVLDTGDFKGLPDPRLENNYNESEMFRMIEAAAACVRHSASMRPRMGLVVRALDCLADLLDLNNGVKPGESELFAGPQTAEIRMFQRMAFGSQDYSSDFSRSSWKTRGDL